MNNDHFVAADRAPAQGYAIESTDSVVEPLTEEELDRN